MSKFDEWWQGTVLPRGWEWDKMSRMNDAGILEVSVRHPASQTAYYDSLHPGRTAGQNEAVIAALVTRAACWPHQEGA